MKKNLSNIKCSGGGLSAFQEGSAVNNFNLIYNKASFLTFIQSPKTNELDFNNSSKHNASNSWSAADDNNEVDISFEREKNSEPKI